MKFAFSSNAFRKYDILDVIRILAEIGYEGIEIMADAPHAFPLHLTPERIVAIKRALTEHGLAVSNVNAFMHHADGDTYHPTWIEADAELRAKRIDYTLRCIRLAAAIGAPSISTEPGGPVEDMSREEALELYKVGLNAVEKEALTHGIRILIEPEPGLLIANSREFMELWRGVNQDVFGLNFDIGHFYCVGEDPAELVKALPVRLEHFHLEDIADSRIHHHLMPGTGAVDIHGTLNALECAHYPGFVTVELYTYEDAPVKAAKQAFEYLSDWRAKARIGSR
jgi:sugar phosphate isomerase/epimerase